MFPKIKGVLLILAFFIICPLAYSIEPTDIEGYVINLDATLKENVRVEAAWTNSEGTTEMSSAITMSREKAINSGNASLEGYFIFKNRVFAPPDTKIKISTTGAVIHHYVMSAPGGYVRLCCPLILKSYKPMYIETDIEPGESGGIRALSSITTEFGGETVDLPEANVTPIEDITTDAPVVPRGEEKEKEDKEVQKSEKIFEKQNITPEKEVKVTTTLEEVKVTEIVIPKKKFKINWTIVLWIGIGLASIVVLMLLRFLLKMFVSLVKRKYAQKKVRKLMSEQIVNLMTSNVIFVGPDEKLSEVLPVMDRENYNTVCVVEKTKLVGFLSEGDIMSKLEPDTDIQIINVKAIMHAPSSADIDTSMQKLGTIMKQKKLRKLAIISKGQIAGMISQHDFLKYLVTEGFPRSLVESTLIPPANAIMTKKVLKTDPKSICMDAVNMMRNKGVGSILVQTGSKAEGIFTEKDYLHLLVKDPSKLNQAVGNVMSKPVFSLPYGINIIDATYIMMQKEYRRLAVIKNGKVAGIISQTDLFKRLHSFLYDSASKRN